MWHMDLWTVREDKTPINANKIIQKSIYRKTQRNRDEMLAQRFIGIKQQRRFDKENQQANYLSVKELSKEYQRLLTEIQPSMQPT